MVTIETEHSTTYIDVIGALTGVGAEREYVKDGRPTKLNVIFIEAEGHKLECTLFGPYVDELNSFIASGDVNNAVVIVQFGKIKSFDDKVHIQDCINCTKVIFNPTCADDIAMRNMLAVNVDTPSPLGLTQIIAEPTKVESRDEFLDITPRCTLQALKDSTKEAIFAVYGKVTRILNEENWWYTSCICSKSVYPDSNMYYCPKCDKHVIKVFPRYCIKLRVMDAIESVTLVLFDKDARELFGKTCAEMIETNGKSAGHGQLPAEIKTIVNCSFLFKVETNPNFNPKFEQTFRIRRVCNDAVIIQDFKEKWDKEDSLMAKNTNEDASLSELVVKAKDSIMAGASTSLLSGTQNFQTIISPEIVNLSDPHSEPKAKGINVGLPNDIAKNLMCNFNENTEPTNTIEVSASSKEDTPPIPKFAEASKSCNTLSAGTSNGDSAANPLVVEAMSASKRVSPTDDMNALLKFHKRKTIKKEKI